MNKSHLKGFTMVELLVVMGIVSVLMALATVSLARFERKSSLSSVVNSMISDVKQQQIKAMAGDGEGSGAITDFGVYFSSTSYTLFRGTYSAGSSDNLVVPLATNVTASTTFPSSEMLFTRGSGEVSGANTITFTDTTTGETKVVSVNQKGVITDIN